MLEKLFCTISEVVIILRCKINLHNRNETVLTGTPLLFSGGCQGKESCRLFKEGLMQSILQKVLNKFRKKSKTPTEGKIGPLKKITAKKNFHYRIQVRAVKI